MDDARPEPRRALPDGPSAPQPEGPRPGAPSRGAVLLALAGVLLAGALGGTIGWGLVRSGTSGSAAWLLLGALVGAAVAAAGAGVVAVLMLRATAEWRGHPPPR